MEHEPMEREPMEDGAISVEWGNRAPGAAAYVTQRQVFKAKSGTFVLDSLSAPGYVVVRHEVEGEPKQILMVIAQEAFISFAMVKPE